MGKGEALQKYHFLKTVMQNIIFLIKCKSNNKTRKCHIPIELLKNKCMYLAILYSLIVLKPIYFFVHYIRHLKFHHEKQSRFSFINNYNFSSDEKVVKILQRWEWAALRWLLLRSLNFHEHFPFIKICKSCFDQDHILHSNRASKMPK